MIKISEKDWKIMEALKDDARASVRNIAAKTGLRSSTVHNRIKYLTESGVIKKFIPVFDNKKIAEDFIIFLMVSVQDKIPDSFFNQSCVREVFGITGEYDIMMKCKFAGIEEFNKFIIEFRQDKNIIKTHTFVVTANIKEEF